MRVSRVFRASAAISLRLERRLNFQGAVHHQAEKLADRRTPQQTVSRRLPHGFGVVVPGAANQGAEIPLNGTLVAAEKRCHGREKVLFHVAQARRLIDGQTDCVAGQIIALVMAANAQSMENTFYIFNMKNPPSMVSWLYIGGVVKGLLESEFTRIMRNSCNRALYAHLI